jgi:SnoaL-like domain
MTLSANDRAALSDLVHRYAAGVDDRQFDSAAALFTPTAELVVPDPPTTLLPTQAHRGQRAIAAAVAAVAQTLRTEHAIVGEVYEAAAHGPHPATAHGRIACIAHHWNERKGELVDVAWHLRYDDDYELTDAGWRVGRRALTINAIETRPVRRVLPRDPD